MIRLKSIGMGSVSYTHLDVYKRQDTIFEMLQEINFPNELIVNVREENLKRMLAQHHKKVLEYMEEMK